MRKCHETGESDAPSRRGFLAAGAAAAGAAWTRDPRAHGYEIVWRPSTESVWTHAIPTGHVAAATVALSKDNVVFGVRSVDAQGRHSPATFPLPAH